MTPIYRKYKTLSLCLGLLFLFHSKPYSQVAHIYGASSTTPGATEYYEVQFDYTGYPFQYTNISFYVTGGTIISQNINPTSLPAYCIVQWDNTPGTGFISVYEDLFSQYAELYVQIGSASIYPYLQVVNYGDVPGGICADYGGVPVYAYQWQESVDQINWNDISGATGSCYYPTAAFQSKYYRCMLTIAGGTYASDASLVQIPDLDPGTISANQQPNFNTSVTVSNTAATGGLCYAASYQYMWEQSIDGISWWVIGTSQNYPGAGFVVTDRTLVRRRITCGSQTLYSNTLEIIPQYTSVDYENLNYVRETTVLINGITSWYQADAAPVGNKLQSTTYLDGFGRPIQSVDKQVSPSINNTWKDAVKYYEYDAAGRMVKDYLPYATSTNIGKFKTDASSAQPAYITSFFGEPSNAPTYGLTNFDNSPLNRALKSMGPGASWAGNNIGISGAYSFNYDWEKVHIWTLDYYPNGIPVTSSTSTYPTGKLSVVIAGDENGNTVKTYSDMNGNIILKKVQEKSGLALSLEHSGWVCTYYVYDDFNQLRYTITPKAVDYLDNNGWSLTQTLVDELCFKYSYDERGRMIVKKQPGIGETWLVYDKKDRLVLSQDAGQRANSQWSFSLYDNLNRDIATGLFDNSADRATLQSYVNGMANGNPAISVFVGNGTYQSLIPDNPIAGSTGTSNYCYGCNASTLTYNSITHYDNYSYSGVKSFNSNNTFAYNSFSNPNLDPTTTTNRSLGFVTGEKIRVLDNDNNPLNDKFLFSTAYYDDKGRALQNLVDNIKNGTDYETNQYDFADKLFSTYTSHNNGSATFTITSKNEFDQVGRLARLSKNFNNTFYKQLSEFTYDELGQLKTKRLAPGYTNATTGKSEMEKLTYDYNIRGWITGINKDYALSSNNYSQWDNYLGIYLGYDNRDNSFAAPMYNGNITGVIWKSQGDNSPRKYDYAYDRLDRFVSALFKQKNKPTASWLSTEVDFSTYMEYEDGNGNIKSMKHYGIVPGVNNGLIIDDLHYTYKPTGITNLNGNKLARVDDLQGGLGSNNGVLGDFKDGTNSNDDYEYDPNTGNLLKDYNKNIIDNGQNGVTYNFLNKPSKIVLQNKSTVEFTYDASGEKLSKKVTPVNGTPVTTYYIGDFVYQDNDLQFVLHEEGRVKIITSHTASNAIDYDLNAGSFGVTWPGGKQGVFEYFIKDHLGSTRMVLTEEVQKEYYKATVEGSASTVEAPLFGKVNSDGSIPGSNELNLTRFTNSCGTTPWPGNCTDITRLTASENDKRVGPNMILKVMAGDVISSRVDYFYYNNNDAGPTGNAIGDAVSHLISALLSPNKASDLSKLQNTAINTNISNDGVFQQFLSPQNNTGQGQPPRAYLNIIFLDEQFKFIDKDIVTPDVGSDFTRVNQANTQNAYLLMQKKAPRNGWVFVYLTNQSNETVYFDNLQVTQEHSRISEENHYYPYGLKIAGISSHAFNKLDNKYGYQGDFSEDESETGWGEFDLRMYDAQTGRWIQPDPYDQFASPFIGQGNDPINRVDPDGGGIWDSPVGWGLITGTVAGIVTGIITKDKHKAIAAFGIGFGLGFGAYYVNWDKILPDFSDLDYIYGGLNITDIRGHDLAMLGRIVTELENITGLTLSYDIPTGLTGYRRHRGFFNTRVPDVAHYRQTSRWGRVMLERIVKNKTVVNLDYDPGGGHHVPALGMNDIHLDPSMQTDIDAGTFNHIDPETLNLAMIVFHEYGHTGAGNSHQDLKNFDDNAQGGYNEGPRHLNRIRRQMSGSGNSSWGRRRTYFVYPDPTTPHMFFMGFDRKSRRALRHHKIPPIKSKYARFRH